VQGGALRFPTQAADLSEASNSASVLVRPLPPGDVLVEAKVRLDLPEAGVFNFQQAALLLYDGDDAFVKLAHVGIWETRQTEWAKEVPQPLTPAGQRYGNTVVGPPGETTWLRIARRGERYTAYTSRDGRRWVRGGTWTHALANPRIGLAAMGGAGHTATFDHVRTYRLRPAWRGWSGPPARDARPERARRVHAGDPLDVREELPPRR
jgi:arabinan endo-1,5-alpha-L-arabinosidase